MMHAATFLMLLGSLFTPVQEDDKEDAKAKEEEAKKKIDEFRAEFAKAKDPEKPACIEKLGQTQHPRILAELGKLLATGGNDCRKAAALQVGRYSKDPKAADALIKGARSNREPEVIQAMLKGVATVRSKLVTKDVCTFFKHANLDVCGSAIGTVETLRSKDAIQPLIDLLRELEGLPDPSGPKMNDKQKRKDTLHRRTIMALNRITNETFTPSSEWQNWWSQNSRKFKDLE